MEKGPGWHLLIGLVSLFTLFALMGIGLGRLLAWGL